MSADLCKYCHEIAYKTNGKGEWICFNLANTGKCEGNKPITVKPQMGRNCGCSCGSGKKYKHCCLKSESAM